jgi:hypothetical protein
MLVDDDEETGNDGGLRRYEHDIFGVSVSECTGFGNRSITPSSDKRTDSPSSTSTCTKKLPITYVTKLKPVTKPAATWTKGHRQQRSYEIGLWD